MADAAVRDSVSRTGNGDAVTSAVTRTDLRGARIVVTGGHGFLGGHVSDVLRERGADVVALGSADYDLREQSAVRALYADLAPDQVVHVAAAVGGIGANVANPGRFLYENAVMGLMLLEEGRRAGLGKFVLASTTCTYATDAPLPLREDDIWSGPPAPATGAYGMAKRLLHEACETITASTTWTPRCSCCPTSTARATTSTGRALMCSRR